MIQNQQNQNGKKFNKKGLAIAVSTAVIIGSVVSGLGAINKSKSAEELAAQKNEQVTKSEVNTPSSGDALNIEATGEQAQKLQEADKIAASEAMADGKSSIGLLPNGQADKTADKVLEEYEKNMVDPNAAKAASDTENASTEINKNLNNFDNNQQNMNNKLVYEVTVRKEIPVKQYEPYVFAKDTEVLKHFVTAYDGKLGSSSNNNGGNGETVKSRFQSYNYGNDDTVDGKNANNLNGINGGQQTNNLNQNSNQQQVAENNKRISIGKVGDIIAAQLETNIDSRRPTMVRAIILEGKLKGAVAIGQFSKNGDGTSVIIQFTSLNVPHLNESIPIQATAVDYNTGSTALASSVNRHGFARVTYAMLNTAAAAFANALSTNNKSSNTKTIVDSNTGNTSSIQTSNVDRKSTRDILRESGAAGVSSAMSELSDLVPQEPTVKVTAMPFGLFITQDIFITPEIAQELGIDF